jgi:phenylpropionate dioxygenase-like ring-hydroxylating dioxygenase large terminal subunit
MITQEQNDALTLTGPGTIMGDLFRRYWVPALHAFELPEPDCPPVRVQLLGEKLVAFRDTEGRIGLIDEFCAHRGVSLWFGRNEECGLRCPYHGWKYDITGQCVDLPSEGDDGPMRKRMKLKAYPCIEAGGLVWTYMGPPGLEPASFRSGCRNAIICRRWKAASIRRMSRSCIPARSSAIRCSSAAKATNTTSATRCRSSTSSISKAGS